MKLQKMIASHEPIERIAQLNKCLQNDAKSSVNYHFRQNHGAMVHAVMQKRVDVVELLLLHGADVFMGTYFKTSLIMSALTRRYPDDVCENIQLLLIKHGFTDGNKQPNAPSRPMFWIEKRMELALHFELQRPAAATRCVSCCFFTGPSSIRRTTRT